MENNFEKPLSEQEARKQEVMERFGDSLTIIGDNETVDEHLEYLGKLPERLVGAMREKGLRVVVGGGNVIDLMSEVPGVKAFLLRLAEKFMAREREIEVENTATGQWRLERYRTPAPVGVYAAPIKTVFAGKFDRASTKETFPSIALHEYGHGLGHLLDLDKSKTLEEAHRRLYPKLIDYLKQGEAGGIDGRKELIAESFSGYFNLTKEQFISIYDEPLYTFWEETVSDIKNQPDSK